MPKIVISHRLHEAGMALLEQAGAEVVITNSGRPADMLPALIDADGVIIRIGSIDRATMEACPKLKVIGRPGVGVDDVDVEGATALGIPVVIAPGANTRSVAEHALAMIFACVKNMRVVDAEIRKGNFAVRSEYKAYELYGKTLGLVGCGAIGKILAQLAMGVGMKIAVYDPFIQRETAEALGFIYCEELDDLLAAADAVSLHTPLTPETKGMIGGRELARMKDTAVLVNCARGGIIDEAALVKALQTGEILAAATDVLVTEPVDVNDPMFTVPNLIVTPHMAGQTKEAAAGVATAAVEGCLAVIRGEKWQKVCNPKAYEHTRWR